MGDAQFWMRLLEAPLPIAVFVWSVFDPLTKDVDGGAAYRRVVLLSKTSQRAYSCR